MYILKQQFDDYKNLYTQKKCKCNDIAKGNKNTQKYGIYLSLYIISIIIAKLVLIKYRYTIYLYYTKFLINQQQFNIIE